MDKKHYDELKPYDRIKILNELFSSGEYSSFQDCIKVLDPVNEKIKEARANNEIAYGRIFRQDILAIRKTIKAHPIEIDQDMLITTGSTRNTLYKYKTKGFNIMPFIEPKTKITNAHYKIIGEILGLLRNEIPDMVFDQLEFTLLSHAEYYDCSSNQKKIDYGDNDRLRGKEWLPLIYKSINNSILSVTYKTFIGDSETYYLHPYLLKHYNNRWFLFGYRPDKDDKYWCVPVDRIEKIEKDCSKKIIRKPLRYNDYFDDIIGVTKGMVLEDGSIIKAENVSILMKVTDYITWKRINTKPIHKSQRIVSDYEGGVGTIEIRVIPNREFYNSVLSIGHGIKIIEPNFVSDMMEKIIKSYLSNYN